MSQSKTAQKLQNEITFGEKLEDVMQKVTGALTVVWGMLPGGRFQITTTDVRGTPLRVWKNLPPALIDYVRPCFKKFSSQVWLRYQDEAITFKQAERIFDAIAHQLVEQFGVQKGDKVGICMRNLPELLLTFLACHAVGAVAVPLNALWKAEELEYAVTDAQCKVMFVDPKRFDHCSKFQQKLGFATVLTRFEGAESDLPMKPTAYYNDVLAAGKKKRARKPRIKADDDCMIMYTSGSTGFPKGVIHTQRSVGTAMKVGEVIGAVVPETNPKSLMGVPLFHITALSVIALASIPNGAEVVMMYKWDAGKAIELISKIKITRFTGVPTMVRDMLEHPSFTAEKVASLKTMGAGGAPVSPTQVAKTRKKAKKVKSAQGYGLTETMAWGTVLSGVDYLKHPTSCGRPVPFMVEIQIKDPKTGKVVADGKRGEVCIKSALLMRMYNNKPEATKKAIDKQGFFHTGDVGKMDGGFLYILDRLKDIIIRGGENIDCSEVENSLASHASVREVSVFGLPDPRLGEVVGAAVWTEGPVTTQELSDLVAKQLAKFKAPDPQNIFLYTEPLPKGATGKIEKKKMRAKYSDIVKARIQSKL